MKVSLVVAAAGEGTRMGVDCPKALVPVAGRPLIERSTASLSRLCNEAVVVIKSSALAHFSEMFDTLNGLPVRYAYQDSPTGTADAVQRGLQIVENEWSIVVWADHVGAVFADVTRLRQSLKDDGHDVIVPVVLKENPYAYFRLGEEMNIEQFHETRRGAPQVQRGWSDCGFFIVRTHQVRRELMRLIDESAVDQNFLSLFPHLSSSGIGIEVMEFTDSRLTLGANTPSEITLAEREIVGF